MIVVILHLSFFGRGLWTDVNVATRAGSDVPAFIRQYPGKTDSLLLTDGPPVTGHAPELGKGEMPWKLNNLDRKQTLSPEYDLTGFVAKFRRSGSDRCTTVNCWYPARRQRRTTRR